MKYTYIVFALFGAIGLLQPVHANAQVQIEFKPHCMSFDSNIEEFAPAIGFMVDVTKGGTRCSTFESRSPTELFIGGGEVGDSIDIDVVLKNNSSRDVRAAAAKLIYDTSVLSVSDLRIDKDYFAETTPGGRIIDPIAGEITIIANADSEQVNTKNLLRVASFTVTIDSATTSTSLLRFSDITSSTTGAFESLDASSDNLINIQPATLEFGIVDNSAAEDDVNFDDNVNTDFDDPDLDTQTGDGAINPFEGLTLDEIKILLGTISPSALFDAFSNMGTLAIDTFINTLDAIGASQFVSALQSAPEAAMAFIKNASSNALETLLNLLDTDGAISFLQSLSSQALGDLLAKLPAGTVETLMNSFSEDVRKQLLSSLSTEDLELILSVINPTIAEQWRNELAASTSVDTADTAKNIGEMCTQNTDCLSDNCSEGVCGTAGTSISNGESCIVDFQCASNFCSEGVCSVQQSTINPGGVVGELPETTAANSSNIAFGLLQVQNVRLTSDENNVYIAWDTLNSSQVQGYTVYYGTVRSQYIQRKTVPQSETSLTIRNLPKGVQYFFSVKAVNSARDETAFSPEVSVVVGSPNSSTSPLAANILNGEVDATIGNSETVLGETGLSTSIAIGIIGLSVLVTIFGFTKKRNILSTL